LIDCAEVDPELLLVFSIFTSLFEQKKRNPWKAKKKDKILKYYYDVFSVFLDFELGK